MKVLSSLQDIGRLKSVLAALHEGGCYTVEYCGGKLPFLFDESVLLVQEHMVACLLLVICRTISHC